MNFADHEMEQLSASLDGRLTPEEQAKLEAALAADPQLRAEQAELQQTISLLRDLPPLEPPRSFALDPAVYGRRRRWGGMALRWASLVGMLVLVAALSFNWVLGDSASDLAQAPQAASQSADNASSEMAPMAATDAMSTASGGMAAASGPAADPAGAAPPAASTFPTQSFVLEQAAEAPTEAPALEPTGEPAFEATATPQLALATNPEPLETALPEAAGDAGPSDSLRLQPDTESYSDSAAYIQLPEDVYLNQAEVITPSGSSSPGTHKLVPEQPDQFNTTLDAQAQAGGLALGWIFLIIVVFSALLALGLWWMTRGLR